MKHSKWRILQRKDVSPSPWFPIVKDTIELPDKKTVEYYKSQLENVSMVLAITKDRELIFVRQYKHGIEEICVELPAGRVKAGSTYEQSAIEELREETGISVTTDDLHYICELWTEPSKSSVRVKGFLVTNVDIQEKQELESTENIEVVKIPLSKIDEFILEGNISASDTLGLLLLAKMKFPKIFE